MIDRFFVLIILGMAGVFAATAIIGLKRGSTRIPLKLIEFEEFDRAEDTTNFWGVTILNFGVALVGLGAILYWFWNGMIK